MQKQQDLIRLLKNKPQKRLEQCCLVNVVIPLSEKAGHQSLHLESAFLKNNH